MNYEKEIKALIVKAERSLRAVREDLLKLGYYDFLYQELPILCSAV